MAPSHSDLLYPSEYFRRVVFEENFRVIVTNGFRQDFGKQKNK